MRAKKRLTLFSAVLTSVLVLDQLSKLWVRSHLPHLPHIELIPGFLDFVYVQNSGSAFGLFANQTFLLIIIIIAILVMVLLFFRYLSRSTNWAVASVALILSGAIGNLIDRLRFGYVTDFIDIHLQHLFYWPTFNFADTAIVVGMFALIYSLYRSGLLEKAYEHDREKSK